ncbi:winged helix-turn-helix domain-containing protein [Pseudomonas sp. SZMC_28357]|uniref:ATP-binding protein n=1 Tax=Pseudomonas sp. SZMC_28357 TaxID=3074380 RepID=UPI002871B137|nr:winged helix-turn-helix domain-containing protein [Pseudomonas sp. SZMC_28357]MDR9750255.1 winged helix-turn-helix domain-containing protein [Pseudomonas sp. SZMC_28357]
MHQRPVMTERASSATLSEIQQAETPLCFGPFVLFPRQHLLLCNGVPVELGSRALRLLTTMAMRPGELIEKSELIAITWPKIVVEECNLRAQMVALRRALAEHDDGLYIKTVAGRGYQFVAPVSSQMNERVDDSMVEPAQDFMKDLPRINTQVIGRSPEIRRLAEQLMTRRLVTITGPGGIGKSAVALAVATQYELTELARGICFVDCAQVSSPQLIPGMLASAMGITSSHDDPLEELAYSFRAMPFLVVLDNCEHAIDIVASTVETLLARAPHCCFLVTSREPLRSVGEYICELPALQVPTADACLTVEQALGFSAVRLFVHCVTTSDPRFVFKQADVDLVCSICRKLDGNALAIDIASARVRAFGLQGLLELLDSRFRLQMTGRRTSVARHRSLNALLDWSYSTLSDDEQAMLQHLSTFDDVFTLTAVRARLLDGCFDFCETVVLLEGLVDKSMLMACGRGDLRHFRLPETTRAYAAEKRAMLMESG